MRTKTRITFRLVGKHGVLVRLPRVFWLYLEFRQLFPRARPARRAWSFLVKGQTVLSRLGTWDAQSGDRAVQDVRRRERARWDAEWEAVGRAA